MNGTQSVGDFFKGLLQKIIEENEDTLEIEMTLPMKDGRKIRATFDIQLTGAEPIEPTESKQ